MKFKAGIAMCALLAAACGNEGAPVGDVASGSEGASAGNAEMRQEIRIVGSSTVYPFSTKVAQEFRNKTGVNVVVESTGSGGGHKLFCEGAGLDTPDITNSSRRQKSSELAMCAENGVDEVIEVKIGSDGIAIANTRTGPNPDLSLKQIFQAFAKQIPVSDTDCTLQDNPNQTWADIDPSFSTDRIEAHGPPPTSGTRDAFVEIAMEGGAKGYACLAELANEDGDAFTEVAHTLREDGRWIDSGENDNAIIQTLGNTPTAIGVFGYSFLDQNRDKVKGLHVDGAEPTFDNVASGEYPISRSLFFYIKKAHIAELPAIREYALEFTSDSASGEGGYLEEIGLIPLPEEERAKYRAAIVNQEAYSQ